MVFACVEPCQSFDLKRDKARKHLQLLSKERKCLHLYFYVLDPQLGLVHLRLQTWFPYLIHICLNGHEWLARDKDREPRVSLRAQGVGGHA